MSRNKKQRIKEKKEKEARIRKPAKKRKLSLYEVCTKCQKKKPLWYSLEQDAIKHENGLCKKCLEESNLENQDN